MNTQLIYKFFEPDRSIADFVYSFWVLKNASDKDFAGMIIPDGKFELFFSKAALVPFQISLTGLETMPKPNPPSPNSVTFAISFKPLAAEYVFGHPIAGILDGEVLLPDDFWGFNINDLNDFDLFCVKATNKIYSSISGTIDPRKRDLFNYIYSTNGETGVKELSEKVFWSSRQINRYFNQQYGISLKSYCNIVRFHASFEHIRKGKLFPEGNFADQSHFIKEIKRLSGVSPKLLNKNPNDRFIQFSVLPIK